MKCGTPARPFGRHEAASRGGALLTQTWQQFRGSPSMTEGFLQGSPVSRSWPPGRRAWSWRASKPTSPHPSGTPGSAPAGPESPPCRPRRCPPQAPLQVPPPARAEERHLWALPGYDWRLLTHGTSPCPMLRSAHLLAIALSATKSCSGDLYLLSGLMVTCKLSSVEGKELYQYELPTPAS